MSVIAYVSDEYFVAIPDCLADFENLATGHVTVLRSSARGAFHADLPPGRYNVSLAKPGFGSKSVICDLGAQPPRQFRLLSDCILGFMWPKWIQAGGRSEFRVHSVEQYQLTLWRYGHDKEFISMIGWYDEHGPRACMQITPDGDFTQTGVRWNQVGYGSPSHTQFVTAPERSGLYYLWARTPSGKAFSFPWVVAPAKPSAPIAVLASTNTWNAYNNFGGRSNYINADRLPDTPIVNARIDLERYQHPTAFGTWKPQDHEYRPLSFERPEPGNHILESGPPTSSVEGRIQCGQTPGEWRLLAWLEREGFAYDYYAEAQLDDGTLPLDEYKVLMLSIHPEYWTRGMYQRVKRWVFERGGRLMYLAGNGLNCEIVFGPGGAMTCLSHVNSVNGELGGHDDLDPSIEYESRLHRTTGESEAALLGVVCTAAGIMTAAPYRVLDASHWIYEGSNLRNGDLFGAVTLHERVPGGASGHETDKMSPSSPPNARLLAKGINPEDGGSEIVYHEQPGGGAVFSVGSITWVPALFTDAAVATITRNVLRRFTT
ncbi:MAG: carboxypeptidase regulatory-like domain-containing protein [Acidobacteria bacterium]|nr:carboxypeptidase regulatory-like domain-containing protein [Acidobacteriota bacterium]